MADSFVPRKRSRRTQSAGVSDKTEPMVSPPTPKGGRRRKQATRKKYEADYIVDVEGDGPDRRFKVKWKNFALSESSFEPLSNLIGCAVLIRQFYDTKKIAIPDDLAPLLVATEAVLPEASAAEGEPEADYEVERIVDMRMDGKVRTYLIKWRNWDESTNTWEPVENLSNCHEALIKFHHQRKETLPPDIHKVLFPGKSQFNCDLVQKYIRWMCGDQLLNFELEDCPRQPGTFLVSAVVPRESNAKLIELFKQCLVDWEREINVMDGSGCQQAPIIIPLDSPAVRLPNNFNYRTSFMVESALDIPDFPSIVDVDPVQNGLPSATTTEEMPQESGERSPIVVKVVNGDMPNPTKPSSQTPAAAPTNGETALPGVGSDGDVELPPSTSKEVVPSTSRVDVVVEPNIVALSENQLIVNGECPENLLESASQSPIEVNGKPEVDAPPPEPDVTKVATQPVDDSQMVATELTVDPVEIPTVAENVDISAVSSAYNSSGRLNLDFTEAIVECTDSPFGCVCQADPPFSCHNRIVTRGRKYPISLMTRLGTLYGWGLFASEDIPKGAFVMLMFGELITKDTAVKRLEGYSVEDKDYLWDVTSLMDKAAEKSTSTSTVPTFLDMKDNSNVGRFLNHLCTPNLIPRMVWAETVNKTFPLIALFANKDIAANDQLFVHYLTASENRFCTCNEKL